MTQQTEGTPEPLDRAFGDDNGREALREVVVAIDAAANGGADTVSLLLELGRIGKLARAALSNATPDGWVLVPREATAEMVAVVVQQVGDPTPEQWAIGERANALLTAPNMLGETACAEVARDWTAMINAAPPLSASQEGEGA